MRNRPYVSVIVPVWNDAERLAHCLLSLDQQRYPPDMVELLVVDNGSSDESRDIASSFSRVLLLDEARCGSYAARNRGLNEASGDYVAFIDSDCEASPGWLENAVSVAEVDHDIGVVAGHIELSFGTQRPSSGSALYERTFAFNQKANATYGLCVTANWLSPRRLLMQFGGFDDALKSGADTKLARRIAAAGYKIVYAERALVYHPVRGSLPAVRAKRRRLVGGRWADVQGMRLGRSKLFLSLSKSFAGEARFACSSPDLDLVAKTKIVSVIFILWGVTLLELFRLVFGGSARRS